MARSFAFESENDINKVRRFKSNLFVCFPFYANESSATVRSSLLFRKMHGT